MRLNSCTTRSLIEDSTYNGIATKPKDAFFLEFRHLHFGTGIFGIKKTICPMKTKGKLRGSGARLGNERKSPGFPAASRLIRIAIFVCTRTLPSCVNQSTTE